MTLSTTTQKVTQWLCQRCGYSWPIKDPNTIPKKCPRCHDYNWEKAYVVGATDRRRKGKRKFDTTARRRQRQDSRRAQQ